LYSTWQWGVFLFSGHFPEDVWEGLSLDYLNDYQKNKEEYQAGLTD